MQITIPFMLLVVCANCFNLSSIVDKDELWNALLRGEIGYNHTNSFYSNDSNLSLQSELELNTEINYYDTDIIVPDDINDDIEDNTKPTVYDDKPNSVSNAIFTDNDNAKQNISFSEKQHVKREHGLIAADNTNINKTNDQLFETVLIDDFDKFIPQLMHVGDSETIEINSFANGSKTIRDLAMTRVPSINASRPKPGQTSLVIVFDGTGSMENCLIQLRTGAKLIIERFVNRSDNPIYNYVFVPFRDPRKF